MVSTRARPTATEAESESGTVGDGGKQLKLDDMMAEPSAKRKKRGRQAAEPNTESNADSASKDPEGGAGAANTTAEAEPDAVTETASKTETETETEGEPNHKKQKVDRVADRYPASAGQDPELKEEAARKQGLGDADEIDEAAERAKDKGRDLKQRGDVEVAEPSRGTLEAGHIYVWYRPKGEDGRANSLAVSLCGWHPLPTDTDCARNHTRNVLLPHSQLRMRIRHPSTTCRSATSCCCPTRPDPTLRDTVSSPAVGSTSLRRRTMSTRARDSTRTNGGP